MKLSQEDSTPFLLPDDENTANPSISQHQRSTNFKRRQLLLAISAIFVIITNVISISVSKQLWKADLDRTCAIHTSQHEGPVLRDVKITYTSISFNGSFSKETIYRQRPGPEVDAAWLDLGIEYDPLIVSDEDADAAGIEKDRFHVPGRYGGPGYPAFVTGLHQLHCLNLLRKSLYFNFDYYRNLHEAEFSNQEEVLKLHIGHCLDILRQRLMCTADTGLTPYIWAGDPPHVTPDFNRVHKCRNYDDIREYAKQNQAKWGPNGPNVTPEAGALILGAVP